MPPQEQQKNQPKPQKGLLQRIFGSGELSPEVLQAIEIAKKEMPDLAAVEPYGFLSRLLSTNEQALVSLSKILLIH
jgi:hypothetical protein